MVKPFEEMDGIENVVSGYTGGWVHNPTYEEVKSQVTGHTEAVYIEYDENKLSYETLLTIYWQQTDPTDSMGQFMDRGESYRPVIFYYDNNQKNTALKSIKALEHSGKYSKPIVTTVEPAGKFYPAEEEHQQFYKKNPRVYAKEQEERKSWIEKNKQAIKE